MAHVGGNEEGLWKNQKYGVVRILKSGKNKTIKGEVRESVSGKLT
jgi:hypothetical protein